MSTRITITTAACQALQSCAIYPFEDEDIIPVKGGKSVACSEKTLETLTGIRFPGESLSDTILRVCTSCASKGR